MKKKHENQGLDETVEHDIVMINVNGLMVEVTEDDLEEREE